MLLRACPGSEQEGPRATWSAFCERWSGARGRCLFAHPGKPWGWGPGRGDARVGSDEQHAAVAEPDMRHFDRHRHPVNGSSTTYLIANSGESGKPAGTTSRNEQMKEADIGVGGKRARLLRKDVGLFWSLSADQFQRTGCVSSYRSGGGEVHELAGGDASSNADTSGESVSAASPTAVLYNLMKRARAMFP